MNTVLPASPTPRQAIIRAGHLARPVAAVRPREADDGRAWAAHLLRRTSLAVNPDRIDHLAGLDRDAAVAEVLDHGQPRGGDAGPELAPVTEDWGDTVAWWVERMTDPDAGLSERMTWFWHGLLTTSADKIDSPQAIATQLDHLRAEGRGDFRTLLHGFVTSAALLEYLDASWSIASNPNENLARELMELFTVGRGHYTEDDVRAGARALAGWVVEDAEVEFRRENAFVAPLVFLGQQARWDTASIVDRLCDDPATAVRVAGLLWIDLVGTPPPTAVAVELGSWWQARDLAIDPLIERILSDDAFDEGRLARPRGGLEWYGAARSAIGLSAGATEDEGWTLYRLAQVPYAPPNVAGWPGGDRWLSPASLMARASVVHDIEADLLPPASSVDEILDACGLHEVSETTISALTDVDQADADPDLLRLVRWRLTLTSPEFNLA